MADQDIQKLRQRLKLSQQELADAFGAANKNVISRWEIGTRNPGETILRLVRLLNGLPEAQARKLLTKLKNYASKNR